MLKIVKLSNMCTLCTNFSIQYSNRRKKVQPICKNSMDFFILIALFGDNKANQKSWFGHKVKQEVSLLKETYKIIWRVYSP